MEEEITGDKHCYKVQRNISGNNYEIITWNVFEYLFYTACSVHSVSVCLQKVVVRYLTNGFMQLDGLPV